MINPLIAALEELPGGLASTIPRLSASVTQLALVGTSHTVPMFDGVPGLLVDQFDPLPSPLQLAFRGYIQTIGRPEDVPSMAGLRVKVAFTVAENPALNGVIVQTQPVQPDGHFEVTAALRFRPGVARPHRVTGSVTIENATLAVEERRLMVDNANLAWFLELIDAAERLTIVSSRQEFLARLRKLFLTSDDFGVVLTRFAGVKALFEEIRVKGQQERDVVKGKDSVMGRRLRAGHHLRNGADTITISHVLIGIEGGRLQEPEPRIPRVDTLVTWAGDLGGALVRHLTDTYYRKNPATVTFDEYIARTASRADLIGDIDGVNLSFSYDPGLSLADNLRAYYNGPGRRRFSTFLDVTETNSGARALAREPGGGPPRLTAASKQFIAEQILNATRLPLIRRTFLSPDTPREKRLWLPPEVEAALAVNSSQIQQLTGTFVTLIEQGLASEPP